MLWCFAPPSSNRRHSWLSLRQTGIIGQNLNPGTPNQPTETLERSSFVKILQDSNLWPNDKDCLQLSFGWAFLHQSLIDLHTQRRQIATSRTLEKCLVFLVFLVSAFVWTLSSTDQITEKACNTACLPISCVEENSQVHLLLCFIKCPTAAFFEDLQFAASFQALAMLALLSFVNFLLYQVLTGIPYLTWTSSSELETLPKNCQTTRNLSGLRPQMKSHKRAKQLKVTLILPPSAEPVEGVSRRRFCIS